MTDILLVSERGLVARFAPESVRAFGRGATGVSGMKLREGDRVVAGIGCATDDEDLVVVSAEGVVLRVPMTDIPRKGRAMMGVQVWEPKSEGDRLVGASLVRGAA